MREISLIKKFAILVFILIIPGFLYYLLVMKGKNRYHPLPKFGPKELAKTTHKVKGKVVPDTIFHTLGDFKLYDQNGQPVSLKTFDNKIFIASFFYTHCPSVCSTINNYLDSLMRNYAKNKMVDLVSITVDPARDSQQVLNTYSKKYNSPWPKWRFLTGDTTTIYHLARQGFLVNAQPLGNGDFVYSDKLILIDSQKRIRGYYSGASFNDVVRLNNEIKVLLSEEVRDKEDPLY